MADTGQGSYKLSSNTKPLICCGQREDFTSTLHGMVRLKRCFTTGADFPQILADGAPISCQSVFSMVG